MPHSLRGLQRRLDRFHHRAAARVIHQFSPLANAQFPDTFNAAGHWRSWHSLADTPSSLWGVDRCLRIRESVDAHHSRVFHMGVFARSVHAGGPARAPWSDRRFQELQRSTLDQFVRLVDSLGIDRSRLQASYFGGATIGGHPDGVDHLLRRPLRLPPDRVSRESLRRDGIKAIVIPAIASLFLQPVEGSLIGPRLEFFYDDLEFATIVFAGARVRRGAIEPCHYVGAYGIGIERMLSVLVQRDFLYSVPRYVRARRLLEKRLHHAGSHAVRREVTHVLFGLEALAVLPDRLSGRRRELVRQLKAELKGHILALGLPYRDVVRLFEHFRLNADL